MDLPRIFKDSLPDHGTNMTLKIGNPPNLKSSEYICMWSDLLGFGNILFENDWQLNQEAKRKLYNRLQKAHSIVLHNSNYRNERNLILNDGIAKVYRLQENDQSNKLFELSLFLRSCIQNHIQINEIEKTAKLPGCRTVLSFGEGIEYLADEIRFDDYVLNYTKPKNQKVSGLAAKNGNPLIIYNPKELQMNIAFAKAYTLESGGSKIGIKGNKFYVEQSIVDKISKLAEQMNLKYIVNVGSEHIIHQIPYDEKNLDKNVLGFKFSPQPIAVKIKNWKTTVYELWEFYPHDESIKEFTFKLKN